MAAPVRMGIIGFGLATGPVVGPLEAGGRYEVVGCADPDPLSRSRFVERFSAPAYESAAELFEKGDLDAVYIATPTRLHEELTQLAFVRGVHVLVEKPIATSIEAAERMIDAAASAGCVLMVNHKHSADRDVLGMWQLTKDSGLGRVRAVHRWHFSDWFYRPRAEDERDPEAGGVVLRQGAHEFDMLRLLLPSSPVRLHGTTGDYDPERPGEGAYHAFIECEDGTVVTSIYNGYDHFQSEEFTSGLIEPTDIGVSRRRLKGEAHDATAEYDMKRNLGHPRGASFTSGVYGFTLMNCDEGDLRPAPRGAVLLYGEEGRRALYAEGPTGTEVIVDELYHAITDKAPALHDGSWGIACLELCLAIRASEQAGGPVKLTHQGSVDPELATRVLGDRVMTPVAD
ncbi:MAG TPA: Gfo/Idh/MocA family oxidoreductase [Acidimicrobiales bacterium]|nr:Gfo/Idh/MocA family oxidoreductase [Acidimicrobiales bacterium]